jgi:hypothetical protein
MVYTEGKNLFSRVCNPNLPALQSWFATQSSPGAGENGFLCGKVRPLIGKAKEGVNRADNEDVDR